MADDKKKQDDKPKKHAHGEGPVTDAKAHAEAKKPGAGSSYKAAQSQDKPAISPFAKKPSGGQVGRK